MVHHTPQINTSSLFKSVAFKLIPMPGIHQRVKIADHNYFFVTDIWKKFGRYSVEVMVRNVSSFTFPVVRGC